MQLTTPKTTDETELYILQRYVGDVVGFSVIDF